MARVNRTLILVVALATINTVSPARRGKKQSSAIVTCPGYPGYCSESYVGDTCLVVCARGRSNVPVCQDDGTWTDEPRCIEHEPGKQEQVPGVCPGVPGYCSLDLPGGLCTFECPIGPAIRSSCTPDGTWEPYPFCQGDPRETQDGCDPCPGPNGGPRNRTAEAGGGSSRGSNNAGTRVGNRNSGGNNRKAAAGSNNRKAGGGSNRKNNRGSSNRKNNGGGASRRNGSNGNKNGGKRNNGNGRPQPQQNNRPPPKQQPRSNSGFSANKNSNGGGSRGKSGGGGGGGCPGEVLEACIDVCPGFSARVFSACVAGCARRCPGRK